MFVGPHSDWQIWRPLVAPGGSRRIMAMLMRRSALSESRPVPRRGLSRYEAAMYLGISASKFDELVRDGRMPARTDRQPQSLGRASTRSGLRFAP